MVRCPDCETPNSTDSKFCKFCGAALPEEELIDAQLKANELLSQGYRIFNEGRTEEARLIAESVLESAPNAVQALTLKAMCCEREGELAQALELYEKVVELNPESALDKIKVTHLRKQLQAKQLEAPEPNKKLALIVAVASVVLVVCAGAIVAALTTDKAEATESPAATALKNNGTAAFDKTGSLPPSPEKPNAAPQDAQQTPARPQGGVVTPPTAWPGGPLPVASDAGTRPLTVDLNPSAQATVHSPTTPKDGNPSASDQNKGNEVDPPVEPEKQPEERRPIIEVVVKKGAQNYGGSDAADSANELTVLVKSANEQFMLGRYQNAAQAYERALRIGADPATTNQRLGQCYANLGRKSEAISAYIRAIDAYKAAIERNPSPALRAGLNACTNALSVLKGE